jgi:phytoene synthase
MIGLYAFNLEVASTRERVSEPMLGQIRLQWWRDALAEIGAGRPRRHPVVESLATWFGDDEIGLASRLIDAREYDLEDAPFETTADLTDYVEATSAGLVRLALQALGIASGPAHDAAEGAGRAYGMAGVLRATPFLGAQGRVLLPAELLARHGIMDARQSIGRRDPDRLRAAVGELAELAGAELDRAGRVRGIPRAARPALMAMPLARLYLGRLRRARFDLSDPRLDPGNAARILTMLRARWLGL